MMLLPVAVLLLFASGSPAAAPTAAPATLTSAATASAEAPKKATKTIEITGDPNEARPVTGGAATAPSGPPGKKIYTGPRGGRYTITEGGNKNYLPRTPPPEQKKQR